MLKPKNILLVRTDRIGELILTTPAIRAVREFFPAAKITFIANPCSSGIMEKSPFVDSVIKFDPVKINAGFYEKLKFFLMIKKLDLDLAIIFNPSRFFNILTFLAGIRRRVGYDRKAGFLLTDRLQDRKSLCEKHEVDYNLELIEAVGIMTTNKNLYFPVDTSLREKIDTILRTKSMDPGDRIIAVHPATSNPEKMWPAERFADLCDRIIELGAKGVYGSRPIVVLIGAKEEKPVSEKMKAAMKNPVIDLMGAFTIKELGVFLKNCVCLISNDSGPVHIAAAVGTPAAVFFGEERPGGSSKRWSPYGKRHLVISGPRVVDITVEKAFADITNWITRL
ncbi:MAG: glycosyltransferase family 9 protein [Candidatus Omnitrophota bacterium]